jgi:glutaredoxin 3
MAEVVMYSTGNCPYCVRAKSLLQKKGVTWKELRVDENPELRPEMESRSGGRRTVPQIFIGDVHVGGFDDMCALDLEGKLDPLLQKA